MLHFHADLVVGLKRQIFTLETFLIPYFQQTKAENQPQWNLCGCNDEGQNEGQMQFQKT